MDITPLLPFHKNVNLINDTNSNLSLHSETIIEGLCKGDALNLELDKKIFEIKENKNFSSQDVYTSTIENIDSIAASTFSSKLIELNLRRLI